MQQPLPLAADDLFAAALRGFGLIGILAILAVLSGNFIVAPLSALLVLVWVWRSRTPWSDIGYQQPTNWARDLALGVAFGMVLRIVMKMIVMPLLGTYPINEPYHYLVGNTAAFPGMVIAVVVAAGFGEETLFRGYMFERFGKLIGTNHSAKVLTVLLTSFWFGLAHYPEQGLAGVQQATIVGLVFGIVFAITGRIWILMFAHATFDLFAVTIIYLDLESEMARLVIN